MQLVLGDYINKNANVKLQMMQVSEIINWFNSHSLALHMLYAEQRTLPEFSKGALSLIRGVITQWTSHVMSLERLLKLSKAMRSIVVKSSEALETAAAATPTAIKKACQIIAIIKEDKFWEDLKESVIPDCDIFFFVIHKILLINTVLQAIFNL